MNNKAEFGVRVIAGREHIDLRISAPVERPVQWGALRVVFERQKVMGSVLSGEVKLPIGSERNQAEIAVLLQARADLRQMDNELTQAIADLLTPRYTLKYFTEQATEWLVMGWLTERDGKLLLTNKDPATRFLKGVYTPTFSVELDPMSSDDWATQVGRKLLSNYLAHQVEELKVFGND